MSGKHQDTQPHLSCGQCRDSFQDYLDGDMPKDQSLRVFLHVRECRDCAGELEQWQNLFNHLGSLRAVEPPAGLDARVLAAVPYAAYRDMAPLRRERVPVFLEPTFLPPIVRAARIRIAGGAIALAAGIGVATGTVPSPGLVIAGIGVLPEVLVRLQALGRRVALAGRHAEGGA